MHRSGRGAARAEASARTALPACRRRRLCERVRPEVGDLLRCGGCHCGGGLVGFSLHRRSGPPTRAADQLVGAAEPHAHERILRSPRVVHVDHQVRRGRSLNCGSSSMRAVCTGSRRRTARSSASRRVLPRRHAGNEAQQQFRVHGLVKMQIIGKMKATLEGRAVAILVADGSDGQRVESVRHAVMKAGAGGRHRSRCGGGQRARPGRVQLGRADAAVGT